MGSLTFPAGQVALVTGAAGGIGTATVHRYAEAGADVALVDAHPGVHETTRAAARAFPGRTFHSFVADVTDEASVAAMARAVAERFGRLDHLALVAGVLQDAAAVEDLSLAEWNRVLGVNLTGPFLVSRAFVPLLRAGGGGTIVSVASFWGRSGRALFSSYCTSKAALIVFTQALADELAPLVRANTVCPGNIDTGMHRQALRREAEERGVTFDEMKKTEWDKIPLRAAGAPETIADAVVYLSSPASSYITGASLDVNGGVVFH
ncbi:SDR family NAD(P)-dependent oxidoreductase [Amycolatopsis thermophila]|uniref:NAD(P)-dependent dehydrogenase (Short-subunit alcohol dehydrogenase family) n=1 Tax=Amycolatopsis thermophila TaxID=206084 RepID=A0ABU0F2M4_9PSEU|nr:SDR family NAD(P)-dependent oxidoreductase [Amycolatopsis thermophila]MDQ0381277.1 NAD(P)-dependent dehydrogenase (short-subunit alcohol dehydrogenase family) [Amycolatopsis thermophila]